MTRNWLNAETVKSCESVRCRPFSSATEVCQNGTVCQRMGGGNTSCGVSPHPQGAQIDLGLVHLGDGSHYPVGQSLLGDSLPFLLTSVTDKELLRVTETPGAVHVCVQRSYGTQQRQGWICLLWRQYLQVHHLIVEGRGGNFRATEPKRSRRLSARPSSEGMSDTVLIVSWERADSHISQLLGM